MVFVTLNGKYSLNTESKTLICFKLYRGSLMLFKEKRRRVNNNVNGDSDWQLRRQSPK